MSVYVHVEHLGFLVASWTMNALGTEISALRDLDCAVSRDTDIRFGHWGRRRVTANAADRDRWCAATEAFLKEIRAIQEEERLASLHLRPPIRRKPLWRLRYARRNWHLRRNYDDTIAALRDRFLAAYETYRQQAGDLAEYLVAFAERERRKQEEAERKRRKAERQERERRAEVVATAAVEPVWAYVLYTRGGNRTFEIFLPSLDDVDTIRSAVTGDARVRTALTAAQIQAALDKARSRHPPTIVRWASSTEKALEEWRGTAVKGWQSLTGALVECYPPRPGRTSSNRFYGPSSNYGSDSGAGGFSGGFGTH